MFLFSSEMIYRVLFSHPRFLRNFSNSEGYFLHVGESRTIIYVRTSILLTSSDINFHRYRNIGNTVGYVCRQSSFASFKLMMCDKFLCRRMNGFNLCTKYGILQNTFGKDIYISVLSETSL